MTVPPDSVKGVGRWVHARVEQGSDRVDRLLDWIGRTWGKLPRKPRGLLECVGAKLQLGALLTPAAVAVICYPVIDRVGPLGSLVIILFPLLLWSHAICRRRLSRDWQFIVVGVYFMVLFAAPVPFAIVWPDVWDRIGEISGYAFRVGLYGLLLAGVILGVRVALGGREQHVVEVAMSGAALAVVAAGSIFIGQFPGWDLVDQPARLLDGSGWRGLVIDLLAAAFIGAVLFLLTRTFERRDLQERWDDSAVPVATAIAWVLPAVFIYAAGAQTYTIGEAYLTAKTGIWRGELPSAAPSSLTSDELAHQYAPQFMLSRDERWPVAEVDGYVRTGTIEALAGGTPPPEPRPRAVDELPRSCAKPRMENPSSDRICFVLTAGCQDVRPSCDDGRNTPWPERPLRQGKVYARVLIRGSKPSDGSPDVFEAPVPYGDLYALIQYWVFYRNDLWTTDTGLGEVTQRHEADWEQVTVGLAREKPLFVAFSAHCGGIVADWPKVHTLRVDGTVRPIVWVARGSHAHYPDPTPRIPDFTSCPRASKATRNLLSLLAFAANVRETLPDTFVRQVPEVEPVDAREQPFSFPSRWSRFDRISLINLFRETEIPPPTAMKPGASQPKPAGPETPTCKSYWRDPLAVLACSPYWDNGGTCTDELKRCFDGIPSGCV